MSTKPARTGDDGRDDPRRTIPILVVTVKDLSDQERPLLHGYAFRILEKGSTSRRELQDLIRLEVTARAGRRVAVANGDGPSVPVAPQANPVEETEVHAQNPAGRRR